MKRYALAAMICLMSCGAYAQHIRDLSLSPEESFRQPNTPSTTENQFRQYQQQNNFNNQAPQMPITGQPGATPSNNFMDGYCDPNFKPLLASNPRYAGMENCIQQQKGQVCSAFAELPPDAQKIIDSTAGCLFSVANGDAPNQDAALYGQPMAACGMNDSARLQLLKKYWNDQNVAYALVFMPDAVMNGAGNCMGGR